MKKSSVFNNLDNRTAVKILETTLNNQSEHIMHEINNVILFRFFDEFGVFNRTTKVFIFFDSFEDAINRVLDFYGDTITKEQLKLKLK